MPIPNKDLKSKNRKFKNKRNMCSLCGSDLYQTSYSNHYCRTNIPIKSNDLIKGFLRKDSLIRKKYPNVQHVWADKNPNNSEEYLLKIKAPIDEIDNFVSELEECIRFDKNSNNQNNLNTKTKLVCSFYNSPDGCKNVNCKRLHIDDPKEKERLQNLKIIINSSKELSEPIKSYIQELNDITDEIYPIAEDIEEKFKENYALMEILNNPIIKIKYEKIKNHFYYGYELDELRNKLKMLSKLSYNNSSPKLLTELKDTIEITKSKIEVMKKNRLQNNELFNYLECIQQAQFLEKCIYVV
tara:strand:- start:398 stop:1291 length:894 start_codon:yes stop_codon:yes gene_type:complete